MKLGYYAAKALIMLAGLAVTAGLLISVLPAVNGGIAVEDPGIVIGTSDDGMSVNIGMDIEISSTMPYDIGLEYGIIVGDESRPIASDHRSVTIAKGQTERITLDMNVPVISVAAHILSKGFGDEPVTIPMTVIVKGDYIQKIIKFDVKGAVEAEIPVVPASVTISDSENTIEARMTLEEDSLSDIVKNALETVSGTVIDIGGQVELRLNYNNGTVTAVAGSDGDIRDIVGTLSGLMENGELAFKADGVEHTLNAEQTAMLIGMIDTIMKWEGSA